MASSKTVLIVEDDQDTRFVFSAILNHDGYRVLYAHDASEGIAMAIDHRPDVILMDVHLPGMSGFEAAEILRADQRTATIPIVAVTADRFNDRMRADLAELLFHSCVWKPIDPRHLMNHVRGIIGDP